MSDEQKPDEVKERSVKVRIGPLGLMVDVEGLADEMEVLTFLSAATNAVMYQLQQKAQVRVQRPTIVK